MTLVAVLLPVVVLLPKSVAILSSGLKILPIMNILQQSEKLYHFGFYSKELICQMLMKSWFKTITEHV